MWMRKTNTKTFKIDYRDKTSIIQFVSEPTSLVLFGILLKNLIVNIKRKKIYSIWIFVPLIINWIFRELKNADDIIFKVSFANIL